MLEHTKQGVMNSLSLRCVARFDHFILCWTWSSYCFLCNSPHDCNSVSQKNCKLKVYPIFQYTTSANNEYDSVVREILVFIFASI